MIIITFSPSNATLIPAYPIPDYQHYCQINQSLYMAFLMSCWDIMRASCLHTCVIVILFVSAIVTMCIKFYFDIYIYIYIVPTEMLI